MMKYLLDTHTFVWLDSASINLSPEVRKIIADTSNVLYLSLTSVWEMQIKLQTGKLHLRASLQKIIKDQQGLNRIELLPITLDHIMYLEICQITIVILLIECLSLRQILNKSPF